MTEEERLTRLSERLDGLGMRFDRERLLRAAAIVRAHAAEEMDIADMALMSIVVEAYRDADREPLKIV